MASPWASMRLMGADELQARLGDLAKRKAKSVVKSAIGKALKPVIKAMRKAAPRMKGGRNGGQGGGVLRRSVGSVVKATRTEIIGRVGARSGMAGEITPAGHSKARLEDPAKIAHILDRGHKTAAGRVSARLVRAGRRLMRLLRRAGADMPDVKTFVEGTYFIENTAEGTQALAASIFTKEVAAGIEKAAAGK